MANLAEIAAQARMFDDGYQHGKRRSRLMFWVGLALGSILTVLFDSIMAQIIHGK